MEDEEDPPFNILGHKLVGATGGMKFGVGERQIAAVTSFPPPPKLLGPTDKVGDEWSEKFNHVNFFSLLKMTRR